MGAAVENAGGSERGPEQPFEDWMGHHAGGQTFVERLLPQKRAREIEQRRKNSVITQDMSVGLELLATSLSQTSGQRHPNARRPSTARITTITSSYPHILKVEEHGFYMRAVSSLPSVALRAKPQACLQGRHWKSLPSNKFLVSVFKTRQRVISPHARPWLVVRHTPSQTD